MSRRDGRPSRRSFSFRLIMAWTKKGGCSDSHALGKVKLVPCNLHRARITHVSADARIQGALSSIFLRLPFFSLSFSLSFFVFIVRSIEASLREVVLSLFFHSTATISSSLSHPLRPSRPPSSTAIVSIYIAKRWTVYRRSGDFTMETWKEAGNIGCGKRNVALYLLLLLFVVVVVGHFKEILLRSDTRALRRASWKCGLMEADGELSRRLCRECDSVGDSNIPGATIQSSQCIFRENDHR